MRSRRVQGLSLLTVVCFLAGCGNSGNQQAVGTAASSSTPGPLRKEEPRVQIQSLTADQLARIVGVNVWTARYSGGPIECWLEIEEEGQSTLPKRIPDKNVLEAGSVNPPSEGTIEFWWSRREDRQGGELKIHAGNGSFSYGLNKDAFTFAWSNVSVRATAPGNGEVIRAVPGKEFVIVDYDASESRPPGDEKPPRRVHLKLLGRFSAAK